MTNHDRREIADRIAARHGCEILPAAGGRVAICVLRYHQQGWPQDAERVRRALAAIEAAGISTDRWLS